MNNNDLYLTPFYEGNISYFETALILGEEGEVSFLFPIKKLVGVYSFSQEIEYVEGIDFKITEKGTLKRLKKSSMPYFDFDKYYLDDQKGEIIVKVDNKKVAPNLQNKFFAYGEKDTFISKQICVTYEHEEKWNGLKPVYQGEKLFRFFNKLKKKEQPTFLFFGDSITVGCNASGTEYGGLISPYMDPWPLLVTKKLESVYGTKINYINSAVGGKDTTWGLEVLDESVIKYNPDLVLIAFGMNEGNRSPEEFKKRILTMIERILKANRNCEFIVVSTTVANPNSNWFFEESTKHIEFLKDINQPNVAIVDMTNIHLQLLSKKEFKDMTGNNVNHPNDYLIRIYAQMILGTILKSE